MRGKDCHAAGCLPGGRITPAYAGKRRAAVCRGGERWDHPRVCGEKRAASPALSSGTGSPPRMRGKVVERCYADCSCGITPAYAGKRAFFFRHNLPFWDHPRVCGEKREGVPTGHTLLGSPPRMRGKGIVPAVQSAHRGITPAYAGKRVRPWRERHKEGDHPRVCGEKAASRAMPSRGQGSPPRMRGKALCAGGQWWHPGITPAYAGKRTCKTRCWAATWDHPRVCGEKGTISKPITRQSGSPPRMRGKAAGVLQRNRPAGITPAYAGKSFFPLSVTGAVRDHPRVCGEKNGG